MSSPEGEGLCANLFDEMGYTLEKYPLKPQWLDILSAYKYGAEWAMKDEKRLRLPIFALMGPMYAVHAWRVRYVKSGRNPTNMRSALAFTAMLLYYVLLSKGVESTCVSAKHFSNGLKSLVITDQSTGKSNEVPGPKYDIKSVVVDSKELLVDWEESLSKIRVYSWNSSCGEADHVLEEHFNGTVITHCLRVRGTRIKHELVKLTKVSVLETGGFRDRNITVTVKDKPPLEDTYMVRRIRDGKPEADSSHDAMLRFDAAPNFPGSLDKVVGEDHLKYDPPYMDFYTDLIGEPGGWRVVGEVSASVCTDGRAVSINGNTQGNLCKLICGEKIKVIGTTPCIVGSPNGMFWRPNGTEMEPSADYKSRNTCKANIVIRKAGKSVGRDPRCISRFTLDSVWRKGRLNCTGIVGVRPGWHHSFFQI